jgi:DNA-binding CsgD family transcriptional regulator
MGIVTGIDRKRDPVVVDRDRSPLVLLCAIEDSLERGDIDPALAMVRSIRRRLVHPVCGSVVARYRLTARELATLELLPDATLSQKDIARSLGISRNTLKTHLRSLYQKLGAHSRAEAIERGGLSHGIQGLSDPPIPAGAAEPPDYLALGESA